MGLISDEKYENRNELTNNHEMASRFMLKQKVIGIEDFEFELMDNDEVRLIEYKNKGFAGKVIIPSFVTQTYFGDSKGRRSPFSGCKCSEIYIDNQPNRPIELNGLCSDMKSTELKVTIRHPECLDGMIAMFSGCAKLKYLDISNFNTKNITSLSMVFARCKSLEEIDLSNFITTKVTSMWSTFSGCESIKYLDLSNFDTSNVVNMNSVFYNCKSLEYLGISNFDTSKVQYFQYAFAGCNYRVHESAYKLKVNTENTYRMFDFYLHRET